MSNLDPIKMLYYVINVIIIFIAFRFLLFKPILKFLNKRRDKVNGELENAAKNKAEAKEAFDKYNAMLLQAHSDSRIVSDRIILEAQKVAKDIVEQAKIQAGDIIKQAENEKAARLQKARQDMRQESIALAADIVKTLLTKELTESAHLEIINSYLEKMD